MSKLKNFVKDLFDLKKPVKTIKGKLTLIGIVLILEIIWYVLLGIIKGFGISKPIIWFLFFKYAIWGPIIESLIFWGLFFMLLMFLELCQFSKMNLLWIPIVIIGLIFGLCHLRALNSLVVAIFAKGFTGTLYGWLTAKTRSLWPNISAHMLWNAAAIFLFY